MNSVKLGDVAKYADGRIRCSELTVSNYVGTDNIRQGKAGKDDSQYVPTLGQTTAYKKGDILIANIRPYLQKIWFADNDGGSSADVSTIRVTNDKYSKKFVFYNLFQDEFFDFAMMGAKGSKMPRLDKKQVLDFPIADFALPVQKSIVNTLSVLDKKIALNNTINAELEQMARLIHDYWFTQFEFPDAQGKPYKSSGGAMVYNDQLKREIPAGWNVESLFDIATFTNGIPAQKYYARGDEPSLPIIKIREISNGISSNTEYATKNVPSKVLVHNGDVLFSWSATLEVILWSGGDGVLNQHIFKVTSDRFPKSFYYYQLLDYLQHFKMLAENRKTTMGHITKDHLIQSKIATPPQDIALKFHEVIKPFIDSAISKEEESQELSKLRDWLLPMLMTGQVKVGE